MALGDEAMSEYEMIFKIHEELPRQGVGRDRYTRQAYEMLPPIDEPRILDIGCGSGAPTLELARVSRGQVIGLDVHQPYLDDLGRRAEAAGLADRITAVQGSMLSLDYPDESFDLVWAEGSIFVIGFDRGLEEWRRLIRPGGFLVVHDVAWLRPDPPAELLEFWSEAYPAIRTIPENLAAIPPRGYEVLGHFPLPDDAWWAEYYGPLEKRLAKLRETYADDAGALAAIEDSQREIEIYRNHPGWYGSVFFLMQKT
jgi:ubiquinone/menaquinone biosynthesis C-methylase UbiE